jgi:uncharacterized protein (TIGR02246 family)
VLRLLTISACLFIVPAVAGESSRVPEDLLAQARPTIEAANADWVPAMKRKDARAIASFYAEDGVLVAPNGKALQGREAVAASYAKGMTATFKFVSGGIVQDGVVLVPGPLIYEWGHAEIEIERDGKPVRSSGNYLTVWKRNAVGKWEISRNLAL